MVVASQRLKARGAKWRSNLTIAALPSDERVKRAALEQIVDMENADLRRVKFVIKQEGENLQLLQEGGDDAAKLAPHIEDVCNALRGIVDDDVIEHALTMFTRAFAPWPFADELESAADGGGAAAAKGPRLKELEYKRKLLRHARFSFSEYGND